LRRGAAGVHPCRGPSWGRPAESAGPPPLRASGPNVGLVTSSALGAVISVCVGPPPRKPQRCCVACLIVQRCCGCPAGRAPHNLSYRRGAKRITVPFPRAAGRQTAPRWPAIQRGSASAQLPHGRRPRAAMGQSGPHNNARRLHSAVSDGHLRVPFGSPNEARWAWASSEKSTPWTRAPPVQPSVQELFANGQDSRSIHVQVHGSGPRDSHSCHASLGLNLLRSTP